MKNLNTYNALTNQRSTGIVFLLWAFLGYFGAHRFYAYGITFFNVVYALTFGFFGIMLIVDFFLLWGMAAKGDMQELQKAQMKDHVMEQCFNNK